jgi:hypothetical protein
MLNNSSQTMNHGDSLYPKIYHVYQDPRVDEDRRSPPFVWSYNALKRHDPHFKTYSERRQLESL